MKLSLAIACFVGLVLIPPTSVQARPAVEKISASRAQGLEEELPTVTVWAGAGTNLNLIPTGETIKKVWLDDPSRIGLDSDEPLCIVTSATDNESCANSTAKVIHLKKIHPIKFPNLPQTATTLLSVVTEGAQGDRKLYQFRINYGKGNPEYHTVTVFPDEAPKSIEQTRIVRGSNLQQPSLESIELGLQIAKSRGLVSRSQGNQKLEKRVQNFLILVRNGESFKSAASQAGVSAQLIFKLAEFGYKQNQVSIPSFATNTDRLQFQITR